MAAQELTKKQMATTETHELSGQIGEREKIRNSLEKKSLMPEEHFHIINNYEQNFRK